MKVSVKAAFMKRVSAIVTYCREKKMTRLRVKRRELSREVDATRLTNPQ